MADVKHGGGDGTQQPDDFVENALGRWSSHPRMLTWQRRVFCLLSFLPILLWLVIAVVFITNYKEFEFSKVHDIATLGHALGLLVTRCGWALVMLLCALCATWGFSVTANMLWGASRKISISPVSEVADRDALPFPISVVVAIAMFWLVPIVVPLFKGVLTAIDVRLYWVIQILSNICCFLPFVILRIWIASASSKKGVNGKFRHPYTHLVACMLFLALAAIVISIPDLPPVTQFVDGPFSNFVNNHCPWILKVLNVTIPVLFRMCRFALALYLAWKCIVHFLKWQLIWVPVKGCDSQESNSGSGTTSDNGEVAEGEVDVLKVVEETIAKFSDNIKLDGEVAAVSPEKSSLPGGATDALGLDFLIDIPDGALPTKDQRLFFDRFVSSYEDARNGFLDNEDPRAPQKQADLILHGPAGSGRTAVLLASAIYAAVVRGQYVLYVVPSMRTAERLARRVNARLRLLMVDCYFSAGVLKPVDASNWLESYVPRPQGKGTADLDGKAKSSLDIKIPPNILFSSPEMIERCFFSNAMTLDMEQRAAMRRILVEFGMFVIDDFIEYSIPVRSHLAFLIDKFRILLATEFVVPQFLVATPPLDAQNIDMLGQRLFGFNRFNRKQNVYELSPRAIGKPFLRGTLVVKRSSSIESAIHILLSESLEKGIRTLIYYRGICTCERIRLEEDFKQYTIDGQFKVIGSLDELDGCPDYDSVFFISDDDKTDVSIRLNMADDANPLFFRIKIEGDVDSAEKTIVLVPDETAIALRAFHLRSVLQYIPPLTPVEASVWSCFGVFGEHPYIKDVKLTEEFEPHVAVQWYQDDMPVDERYAEGQIWAYLVLATKAAISTRGHLIDFSVLPSDNERIWVDRESTGRAENRILLMNDGEHADNVRRQMLSWRDSKNVRLGESDLAHAEKMSYIRPGSETYDEEEYTIGGIPPQEDLARHPGRFAFAVSARYRRGTEEEYVYPVKRLSWNVPTRNMEVVDLSKLNGMAQFMLRLNGDVFYKIDGLLKGLLNLRGQEQDYYPPKEFAYDAYMSCVVLKPSFRRLSATSKPEDYVRECMRGRWVTSTKSGFSSAMTHAVTAAFRRRFSGWSFFALSPAFYIEGREGSIGKAVIWIVEPANSGRTVWPVIKEFVEESAFWSELIDDACAVLEGSKNLWQLRMCSKLAFADEKYDEDDVAKALEILKSIQDKRKRAESTTDRNAEGDDSECIDADDDGNKDDDADASDDGESPRKETAEETPRKKVEELSEEEKGFEKVVIASLKNFEDTIDVTNTAFVSSHSNDPGAIMELFNDILWNHPEIFYISKSARYQYWTSPKGEIVRFVIRDIPYGIARSEYSKAKAELDFAVKEAMMSVGGSLSDVEKARVLHDYIIKICDYDTEAVATHDSSPAARTVYSVLVRHKAVCEGYTMAYRYLLAKAGIISEEVVSDKMNHCWNYVKIDENWYHVDVTWDDPIVNGRIVSGTDNLTHEHFLLSDARIRMKEHHDWNVRGLPPATDTTYDESDWSEI